MYFEYFGGFCLCVVALKVATFAMNILYGAIFGLLSLWVEMECVFRSVILFYFSKTVQQTCCKYVSGINAVYKRKMQIALDSFSR